MYSHVRIRRQTTGKMYSHVRLRAIAKVRNRIEAVVLVGQPLQVEVAHRIGRQPQIGVVEAEVAEAINNYSK